MQILRSTCRRPGGWLWACILASLAAIHLVAGTPLSTTGQPSSSLAYRSLEGDERSALQKRETWVFIGYRYVSEALFRAYERNGGYLKWRNTGNGEQLGPGIYIAQSLGGSVPTKATDVVFQVEVEWDSLKDYITKDNKIVAMPENTWGDEAVMKGFLLGNFGDKYTLDKTIRAGFIEHFDGEKQLLWPRGMEKKIRLRVAPGKAIVAKDKGRIDMGPASWEDLQIDGVWG